MAAEKSWAEELNGQVIKGKIKKAVSKVACRYQKLLDVNFEKAEMGMIAKPYPPQYLTKVQIFIFMILRIYLSLLVGPLIEVRTLIWKVNMIFTSFIKDISS